MNDTTPGANMYFDNADTTLPTIRAILRGKPDSMKHPEPPPIAPRPNKARRRSPLTPREQRMLDQARRWRAKGLGEREQRRLDLRMWHYLSSRAGRVAPDAWISTSESDHHWLSNP